MKKALALIALLALPACSTGGATYSAESDPAYVSPNEYADYNCKQIRAHMRLVSSKIDQKMQTDGTQQVLNTALSAFAISQGYGVDERDDVELRRYKNQYSVLEETGIKKSCNL